MRLFSPITNSDDVVDKNYVDTRAFVWNIVNRTSSYPAINGDRVFCNTTSTAFSVTAPSGGGTFSVVDAVGTSPLTGFYVNNLTILPNTGQTIMGTTSLILDFGAVSVTLQLVGTDWRIVGN